MGLFRLGEILGLGLSVLGLVVVGSPGCMRPRARATPAAPTSHLSGSAATGAGAVAAAPVPASLDSEQPCRPLEPDEEVVLGPGTSFVMRKHSVFKELAHESTVYQRWRILEFEAATGKVRIRLETAAEGGRATLSDPMEQTAMYVTAGDEPLEIVEVPAGRIRCKRTHTVTQAGRFIMDSWQAPVLPNWVHVRQVTDSPQLRSVEELLRVENASVAPPGTREAKRKAEAGAALAEARKLRAARSGPAVTVGADERLELAVGTRFTSETVTEMRVGFQMTMTMLAEATVMALDERKLTLRTIMTTKTGGTENTTETSMELERAGLNQALEGAAEVIEVPAGKFRCRKSRSESMMQGKRMVMEHWMAPGIPVPVRSEISGDFQSSVTVLERIENARTVPAGAAPTPLSSAPKPGPAEVSKGVPQPAGAPGVPRNAFILVVGVGTFGDGKLPSLRFAEADARSVFAFCSTERRSPADPDRVQLLVGKAATRQRILDAVRDHLVKKATHPEDLAVLYFSGHALMEGGETYLACSGTEPGELAITGLPLRELGAAWASIRAGRRVLIADACRIGDVGRARGTGRINLSAGDGESAPGSLHLLASGPEQPSTEDEQLGQGVFTTALLKGLRGEAESDADGRVSSSELAEYLEAEVPRLAAAAGGAQTPVARGADRPGFYLTR
ncbi:MAG: caspase family protein [Planctomycetales bacterium]|nr:caspase family protein [Planctomycetales bacterium]